MGRTGLQQYQFQLEMLCIFAIIIIIIVVAVAAAAIIFVAFFDKGPFDVHGHPVGRFDQTHHVRQFFELVVCQTRCAIPWIVFVYFQSHHTSNVANVAVALTAAAKPFFDALLADGFFDNLE